MFESLTRLDKDTISRNQDFRISQFLNGQLKNLDIYEKLINLLPSETPKSKSKKSKAQESRTGNHAQSSDIIKIGPTSFNQNLSARFKEFSLTHQGFTHYLLIKFLLQDINRKRNKLSPLTFNRKLNDSAQSTGQVLEFLQYLDQRESSIMYDPGMSRSFQNSPLKKLDVSASVDPFGGFFFVLDYRKFLGFSWNWVS